MKNLLKLDIKLFDDGGGAEGSGPGEGSQVAAELTGREESAQVDNVQVQTAEGTTESKVSFEDMIKNPDYKAEHDAYMQKAFNARMKEVKQNERTMTQALEKSKQLQERLAGRYGVEAEDIDSIIKAFDSDSELLEKEAMEKGLTVDQLKQFKDMERNSKAFERQQQQTEKQAKANQIIEGWKLEGEILSQKYEGFNFDEHMNNPDFVDLLSKGVSVEAAFQVLNFDDLVGGAMAQTAKAIQEKTVKSIQSRGQRPNENGTSPQSGITSKLDVNNMTKQQREELAKKAARGEIISF